MMKSFLCLILFMCLFSATDALLQWQGYHPAV